MLSKLRAWLYRLLYRFDHHAGACYAEALLAEGLTVREVMALPDLTPSVMPNQAYADGFFHRLHQEIHHA